MAQLFSTGRVTHELAPTDAKLYKRPSATQSGPDNDTHRRQSPDGLSLGRAALTISEIGLRRHSCAFFATN